MILSGTKVWEMRSRPTTVRGRIALIRAGSGNVVGTANLTGCGAPLSDEEMALEQDRHGIPAERTMEAIRSGWTVPWFLSDASSIDPVPYLHPKGAVSWVRLSPCVSETLEKRATEQVAVFGNVIRDSTGPE